MNGEGYSCYEKDEDIEPNLGIYSEDTFKHKSERLDKLGSSGLDKEFK